MQINASMLARTRAEEHDADVWGEFFIPPYFDRLALTTATKAAYITGKRGCGKTMLLKYFDYHTAFSKHRTEIPADAIGHVGIYWRVDTQFCSSLKYRGIEDAEWSVVFESYFGLVIATELLRAVEAIAESSFPTFTANDLTALTLPSAADYLSGAPTNVRELVQFLESLRRKFTTWVSNVNAIDCPVLPPGRDFVLSLVGDLRSIASLASLSVFVYVDEIENLVPYQRHVLNSFLKHSQRPLIVSFTSKEHPSNNETSGPESINATHDYRLVDLDYYLELTGASMPFFAEVFLGNLDIAAQRFDSELLSVVRSQARLVERQALQYQKDVVAEMRKRFPNLTDKQIATNALQMQTLKENLHRRIGKALKDRRTNLAVEDFVFENAPAEALVTLPALLNRETLFPENVLIELKKYAESHSGSFSTTWIHNNLFGAILELYRPYARECPLYAGFDTLCTMSNNNLRNFLILCYKTLEVAELRDQTEPYSVDTQCRAAYDASEQLIKEIRTFGRLGEQLRVFVLRLGSIFRALQASPAMSEPEQNQFTINSGGRALQEDELAFIAEALRYGILVEQLETKSKSGVGQDIVDYQLNPIYAPYFQISYRRKRKLEISVEQFHMLIMGNENEYRDLARGLARQLSEADAVQLGLILS